MGENKQPKWMEGWRAVTGRTGKKREDGSELRYIPSVQFGNDAYWSSVIHVHGSLDEHEDAARFIAAAPLMLEALREDEEIGNELMLLASEIDDASDSTYSKQTAALRRYAQRLIDRRAAIKAATGGET